MAAATPRYFCVTSVSPSIHGAKREQGLASRVSDPLGLFLSSARHLQPLFLRLLLLMLLLLHVLVTLLHDRLLLLQLFLLDCTVVLLLPFQHGLPSLLRFWLPPLLA